MKDILKVTKFQLYDFKKPIISYYMVISILIGFMITINLLNNNMSSSSGFGFTTAVFLFIAGLNCFKSNFKFMQSLNVSRKRFLFGTILSFLIIAFLTALFDIVISLILNQIINYSSAYESIFQNTMIFREFLWLYTLFLLMLSLGFCITMLYYKCGKIMTVMISLSPILILIIFSIVNDVVYRGSLNHLGRILGFMLGITPNAYVAVVIYFVEFILLTGINYLFLRRMVIKS